MRSFGTFWVGLILISGLVSCNSVFEVDNPGKVSRYLKNGSGKWKIYRWHQFATMNDSGLSDDLRVLADSMVQAEIHLVFTDEIRFQSESANRMALVHDGNSVPDTFEWVVEGEAKVRQPILRFFFRDSMNFTGLAEIAASVETWDEDVIDFTYRTGTMGYQSVNRIKIRREF
ncbi:MAG: hypothetical protein H6606_09830 [Flavobacteriales bacterium]|nr:hypothetical protein [Flavobacteriales bacterium]